MNKSGTLSPQLKSILIFLVLLVAVILFFTIFDRSFLAAGNIRSLLRHNSRSAIAALGLTFVIIVGHFDMSFGLIGSLAAMTTSFLIGGGHGVLTSVLVGLVVGALWGLINGEIIARWKLPDMVVTIGTGAIAFGLSYIYSRGAFIYRNFLTSGILEINDGTVLSIPLPAIYLIVAFVLGYLVLHRTVLGRKFYAVGENYTAAVFSGIRVQSFVRWAFVIAAGMGSLTAILATASQGVGNVKTGTVLLLPSYAIVYLGIAIFKKPTVLGTLMGSIFITLLLQGFTMLNVPFYSRDLIISFILIIALGLSLHQDSLRAKRALKHTTRKQRGDLAHE